MFRRLLSIALIVLGISISGRSSPAGAAAAGTAWAWGENADGQLGNGSITKYGGIASPGMVKNLSNVTAVVGGSEHSLALDSRGTVWAWGNGTQGELGQGGGSTFSATPLKVPGLSGMTAIAAGDQHSLALKSDGTVWAWGANNWGQIGNGTSGNDVFSPVQVSGLMGVVAIAAGHGGNTSYALKSDGTVWAWGYDAIGELGDGTADLQPHPTPTKVSNLTGVIAIGAGADHGLALESDGTVWAWGFNLYGQLGATTTTTCVTSQYPCSTVPVKVSNLSGVTAVAGGQNFSLALKSDGTVWCWGDNGYGQCANGTTSGSSGVAKPTEAHLSSITAIAAGANHTMALKSNGTVWAAGYGRLGQLGTGAFTDSSTPVQVIKVSGMIVIGAGMNHSLAVEV